MVGFSWIEIEAIPEKFQTNNNNDHSSTYDEFSIRSTLPTLKVGRLSTTEVITISHTYHSYYLLDIIKIKDTKYHCRYQTKTETRAA